MLRILACALGACALAFGAPACGGGGSSEQALIGKPGNPETMKHVKLVLATRGGRLTPETTVVGYGAARSYIVDRRDVRVRALDRQGNELGVMWFADPRIVRVFDNSDGSFHEHAFMNPSANVTIFVPFLTDLSRLVVGYPGKRSSQIDLTAPIRDFCRSKPSDSECQAWLEAHRP